MAAPKAPIKTPVTDPATDPVRTTPTETMPVQNVTEGNTVQMTAPTDKDLGARSEQAVEMIVARTGQLPADQTALVAELADQVRTEAEAETQALAIATGTNDALNLERLDHARTLAQALGVSVDPTTEEDRVAAAKARNEVLLSRKRDTSKDNVANSRPANWAVNAASADGDVDAYNTITGKTYKGPAADMFKQVDVIEDA